MKQIMYFKRNEPVPKGAIYLCVKKKIVKEESTKTFPVYEDIFVYEVEQDLERIKDIK